jgi:nucleoside 2-deoxyribosyltransferase
MKTFLISPVAGHAADAWIADVEKLEQEGYEVHWPARDTDQVDATGFRICNDNLAAIRAADVVHVIWDGVSRGCMFDLGMAFALSKKIIPIRMPEATQGKSIQNVVAEWAAQEKVPPMKLVILESPYAGDVEANIKYARAAVHDSLSRGEAPIASHLLYTQDGILDDNDPQERKWGIDAGLAWKTVAHGSVVYADKGITRGMEYGIEAAKAAGIEPEIRYIMQKPSE